MAPNNDPFICSIKRTFETEQEALEEMKWLRTSKEYKKLKRAYVCGNCGKWHLTSKNYMRTSRDELQKTSNGPRKPYSNRRPKRRKN